MRSQLEKAEIFRALHERERAFIIPNPWDAGTARMLAHLGFEALATTSAGNAFSLGLADGKVGRERTLANVAEIAAATELPVSGDLENGFGDAPEAAAETIRMAAAAGLVGGSIEDATGRPDAPIYAIEHAIERIEAAAEAARSLPFPFTLTARAENYLYERRDLKDTIHRLRTYQEAGADVLYAPGLTTTEEIAAVASSVDRPVNVLMGLGGLALSVEDLSEIGVRRISVGGALCRMALGAFLSAAREMKERGTFGFTKRATRTQTIVEMLGDSPNNT
jgi:2-methylisocitrate lyase-like PEP mutase family enzyme